MTLYHFVSRFLPHADVRPINSPDRNAQQRTLPEYIQLDNGGKRITLDGMKLTNVVIENADIHYDGGPVDLKNVEFVNCTFSMKSAPSEQKLMKTLLAMSEIVNVGVSVNS